jgi:hypothetical protein
MLQSLRGDVPLEIALAIFGEQVSFGGRRLRRSGNV